jgi:hypothetical protein
VDRRPAGEWGAPAWRGPEEVRRVKLRVHGTSEECAQVVQVLRQVLDVVSESEAYPDRGRSRLVRVYLDVRLHPDGGQHG